MKSNTTQFCIQQSGWEEEVHMLFMTNIYLPSYRWRTKPLQHKIIFIFFSSSFYIICCSFLPSCASSPLNPRLHEIKLIFWHATPITFSFNHLHILYRKKLIKSRDAKYILKIQILPRNKNIDYKTLHWKIHIFWIYSKIRYVEHVDIWR